MSGVGKTTLMKNINNHFRNSVSYFDIVIWVTVSAHPDLKKVRRMIWERLGLPYGDDHTEDMESHILFDILKRKEFLLILDDLWDRDRFDIKEIGIPRPKNGSKIAITTQNGDVCSDMGADSTVEVKKLSEDESWELFCAKAGPHVASPTIEPYARPLLKKCDGLPLAIVVSGRTVRGIQSIGEWEYAKWALGHSPSDMAGMEKKVFGILNYNYDKLDDKALKHCFLYCALYPQHYLPGEEELLNYCIEEGLVGKNLKDARSIFMGHLKTTGMLETGDRENTVRMHDMMRELALWITFNGSQDNPMFLVHSRAGLVMGPDAQKVSLMGNNVEALPELKACPKLRTLNFFKHMTALRVLDLSGTSGCRFLRGLPSDLRNLKKRQILDLSGCDVIKELPVVVGELANLRCASGIYRIPPEILSKLRMLEQLVLMDNNLKWHIGGTGQGGGGASTKELTRLSHLTSIDISLTDVDISHWLKLLASRTRDNVTNYALDLLEGAMNLQHLSIFLCTGMIHAPTRCLESLGIDNCGDLEHLKVGTQAKEDAFQRLAVLHLSLLPNLKRVCTGVRPSRCFGVLRTIDIEKCPELQILFTKGIAQNLRIRRLEIGVHVIPKLRRILLFSLPELTAICHHVLNLPSLEEVNIWECPKLKKLPLGVRNPNELLKIEVERQWWQVLEWKDHNIMFLLKSNFVKFKTEQ
ncbi:hypothetical protein AMTRI_Chr09g32700 [Amborella trichopoda]